GARRGPQRDPRERDGQRRSLRRHGGAQPAGRRHPGVLPTAAVTDYALLVLPSTNPVYGRASPALAPAELPALAQLSMGGRLSAIEDRVMGGVPYVTFRSPAPLEGRELA